MLAQPEVTLPAGSPSDELAKMWSVFPVGIANPISLRAISPAGIDTGLPTRNLTFRADVFEDVLDRKLAFSEVACALNQQGYNVYFVINPVRPDFEGDLTNRLAVSDPDITYRHRLLIDLDRAGRFEVPATEGELNEAKAVGQRISAYIHKAFGVTPFEVMSGNGTHLYLPLANVPNDGNSRSCCQRFLQALSQRFNTDTIKVDTSVFNASRITKVPGTVARKGIASNDRPHRMARVL